MARKHRGRVKTRAKPKIKLDEKLLLPIIIVIIVVGAIGIGIYYLSSPAVDDSGGETYLRACLPTGEPGDPSTCLPDSVFRDLPSVPNDFWPVVTLIRAGRVADMCGRVNESYWKQPEMLPTFYTTGVPDMLTTGRGRVFMGYGAFPGEVLTSIDPDVDSTIRSCFFVMAGWHVSTYQGMHLSPAYPGNISFLENRFHDGTMEVTQDSEANKGYFTISVTPENLLLEPAWGYFYNGWIQKVDVLVTVSPDTPPGKYIIGVNPTGPPVSLDQEWLWEYKTLYVPIGGFGLDRPFYSIGVEVV